MMKIDQRKRYFCVFDTETTRIATDKNNDKPLIYDLGFAICDKNGEIYESYNFMVQNIYYSELMENAFFADRRPWYDEQIANGVIPVRSFGQILYNMNKVMSRYPNMTLCAYNLDFDLRALKATAALTRQPNYKGTVQSLFTVKFELQDIWGLAVESIYLPQKGYKRFIDKFDFYTPKGNPQTGAEIGYRYIVKDSEFIEDHTALSDVYIEVEILSHALRQKKKYSKGILPKPWKLVAEELGTK